MVRKKFDRTVVKRCPDCGENVPVACKFCTCGHQFATRNKILLKEEADEAMGLLDDEAVSALPSADNTTGKAEDAENNSSSVPPAEVRRSRPRRLTRERPNYYVITPELNRHVKKKARQQRGERTGRGGGVMGASSSALGGGVGGDNIIKKKKRGRPRGSVSASSSATRSTRSNTRNYPSNPSQLSSSSHGIHIKKEDLGGGFTTDSKSSLPSNLTYGCVGDKPLTNVTVSICTANNSCCTNLSNCSNVTKHHYGTPGGTNHSSYSSSSDGSAHSNSGSHGKDSNQSSSNTNGHSNTNNNIKNEVTNELSSNTSSNNTFNNNSTYNNNNNNSNNQKESGGEKDEYSSMNLEKAMKFYAILADVNRKIISQSFKPC